MGEAIRLAPRPKLIAEASLGITSQRALAFLQAMGRTFKADSGSESPHPATNACRGATILFRFRRATNNKDSVRKTAEGVPAQLTTANSRRCQEVQQRPGSAPKGGSLGAFRRERWVKPFSDAVPRCGGPDLDDRRSQFGTRIPRPTYAEAKTEYDARSATSMAREARTSRSSTTHEHQCQPTRPRR